jgi:hypothetical protein
MARRSLETNMAERTFGMTRGGVGFIHAIERRLSHDRAASRAGAPSRHTSRVNPSVQHKDPVKKESQQGCRKVKARPVLQYLR